MSYTPLYYTDFLKPLPMRPFYVATLRFKYIYVDSFSLIPFYSDKYMGRKPSYRDLEFYIITNAPSFETTRLDKCPDGYTCVIVRRGHKYLVDGRKRRHVWGISLVNDVERLLLFVALN